MDREINEMRWFKCFGPSHPIMSDAISAFGFEGYGYMCALMAEHQNVGDLNLTPEFLSRLFGINKRKSFRIFSKVSECFAKLCQSLPKFDETLPKFDETFQSFGKLEASNPRGSIKEEREIEREIEREERKILEPHIIPDDFAIDDGMLEWCRKKYGSVPDWLEADLPEFIGYWKSKGTMRAGWTRTWQKHIDHCMAYEKEPKSPARLSDNWHEPVRGAI